MNNDEIINDFHKLYYESFSIVGWPVYWKGVHTYKCPLDLWIYQEIINDIKPDVIIETGTKFGGSALYLANICDLMGKGEIYTIDINDSITVKHDRITFIKGSSTSSDVVELIKNKTQNKKVMVILDSDHHFEHVKKELELYGDIVSYGSYLIVEDSNVNGNPVLEQYGPGPMEAIEEFLTIRDDYIIDKSREKFLMTKNPSGYLRRRIVK